MICQRNPSALTTGVAYFDGHFFNFQAKPVSGIEAN
jgi:hypothetical protein